VPDCVAASKIGGSDKICPNGCIGLGTCVAACPVQAIQVEKGVAAVDYSKCIGCGVCTHVCPRGIIQLIPFGAKHWVGCKSEDLGKNVRKYCDVGCIACKLCVKNCPENAIAIENNLAVIDYSKCTGCDKCVSKCPRKIIWSGEQQGKLGLVIARIPEDALKEIE
jgi:ferredoxin